MNSRLDELPEVADGETIRTVCPRCGGGSSGERSLSCTRDGVVVYFKCWRASCDFYGRRIQGVSYSTRQARTAKRTYDIVPVPDDAKGSLRDKVRSPTLREQAGYSYLRDRTAFAFPVFKADGTRGGHVLRTYTKGDYPKALSQTGEYAGCAWWSDVENPTLLVVVEDIPSAAWLNDVTGISAVALMGASLSRDKLDDLLRSRARCIIVCLDPDALAAAIEMAGVLKHRGAERVLVHQTETDIKDMPEADVLSLGETLRAMAGGSS